jgi:hypothetical protein
MTEQEFTQQKRDLEQEVPFRSRAVLMLIAEILWAMYQELKKR